MAKADQRLIVNTFYSIVGRFVALLSGLVLTPLILKIYGKEGFGFYALVFLILNYASFFDLGFSSSFIRHTSAAFARKKYKEINNIVSIGFFYNLAFSLLCILIIFPLDNLILSFFVSVRNEHILILKLSLFIFLLVNVSKAFSSIYDGIQLMHYPIIIGIITNIGNLMLSIYLLTNKHPLYMLFISILVFTICYLFLIVIFIKKIYPQFKLVFSLSGSTFKRLFMFGIKLQVSRLAELINMNFDKLIISRYISLTYLAFYEVGSKITNTIRSFILSALHPMLPKSSEIHARRLKRELEKLYSMSSKYLLIFSIWCFGFIFVFSNQIITLWIGNGYEKSFLILRLLSAAMLANVLSAIASTFLQAINKPGIIMKISLFQTIANIILSLILFNIYGYYGLVVGTTIALIIGFLMQVLIFHRIQGYSISKLFYNIYLLPVCSLLVISFISRYIFLFINEKVSLLISFVIIFMVFSSGFIFLLYITNYINRSDFRLFKKFLISSVKRID